MDVDAVAEAIAFAHQGKSWDCLPAVARAQYLRMANAAINTQTGGNLIGLTPGERDAARKVAKDFTSNRWCADHVVDAIVDAINEHRARTNELSEQHGCHR